MNSVLPLLSHFSAEFGGTNRKAVCARLMRTCWRLTAALVGGTAPGDDADRAHGKAGVAHL